VIISHPRESVSIDQQLALRTAAATHLQRQFDGIAAMAECGIDIAGEYSKPWTDEVVRAADVVVTMGCGDACPVFPGHRYLDWPVDDPAGLDLPAVRPIRDDIERRVRALLDQMHVPAHA